MRGISAVVLAAGSSRRMGADKLSLPWGDGTVLDAAVRPFVALPEIDEVVVVVRAGGAPPMRPSRAAVVVNERADDGMGSSLRVGVAAANPDAEAYVLALGDMPALRAQLVGELLAAWRSSGKGILVPVHWAGVAAPGSVSEGRRGHPVVLSGRYRAALLASSGDVGARRLVAENEADAVLLEVADAAVVTDLDTAEAYRPPTSRRGTP